MKIVNPTARLGEDAAASYLKRLDYTILERNFRKGYGEIDIIAVDPKKQALIFVEVKTRSSNAYGTPLEAITYFKLQTLIRTSQFYKHTHFHLPDALRIDAIAVTIANGEVVDVEHMKNISGF